MDGNLMMTMGQKSDEIMGRSTKRLRFSDIFSGIFVGYESVFVGTLWPCFDMRSDRFCPHEPAERHILSWPTLRRWPTRATPTGIHRYMASGPSSFVQGLRDLSWVITESFATRDFSWPSWTQVMFRRHRRIPLDANLKDTFTLEAVTQWCRVAVAGPCSGKLILGDTGFLIPMGLVIILSHFPSESGLGLRSRSWRWRVATAIWNKARTPSMWLLRWGRTFLGDFNFGKITQMSGKTYVQKKMG